MIRIFYVALAGSTTIAAAAAACRQTSPEPAAREPAAHIIYPVVASQELPLPPCQPDEPPPSLSRRNATVSELAAPHMARLLVQLRGTSQLQPLGAGHVTVTPGFRRGIRSPDGTWRVDSIAPGLTVIHVRALGFVSRDDTVTVRAGHADTLIVHMNPLCK